MAELNDLMKNSPFRCQKCGAELTSDWLLAAVMTYGVALLAGEKDGWVGWSCPGCSGLAANFTRLGREPFDQVVDAFRNTFVSDEFGRFCYHSFPYQCTLEKEDFSGWACRELDGDFETVLEAHLFPDEPDFKPPAAYCSYLFGNEAVGPAIAVWWYEDAQIEKLIERENETGLRQFPRYIVHNPLYSRIDDFCWHNQVHFDYLKASGLPFDVKEIFLSSEKKRITKAVDFMLLIDTVHSAELSSFSQTGFQAFISPPAMTSDLIAPVESSPNRISIIQHERLSSQVWAAFHADWMQELLESLAKNFISDYLGLIGKIDCSLSSIWALKEAYLKDLFDVASSRYKRDKVIEKTKASLRKRVIEAEKTFPDTKIISQDTEISNIKIFISQVAPVLIADSFLILGEPGTGKELFAKAIHEASRLDKKKFRKISCGERSEDFFISEIFGHVKGSFTGADRTVAGALAEANGGTVFFDEIGNLPLGIQPKLLRVLQDRKYVQLGTTIERPFVGKFIFATNKDLDRMVEEGLFMPDLYDRFNVFKISIPALRSRKEDIPLLVEHFVREYGNRYGGDFGGLKVTTDCMKYLKSLDWKGNIRTLENAIKDILARRIGAQDRSDITVDDLPAFITHSGGTHLSKPKKTLPGNTKITDEELIDCLTACENNKTRAAEMLGVDPCTIHRRLKKLTPQA